jgi:nucleoside-diphosphate-sugar epimerase
MRFLVTGGSGFIASNLIRRLASEGNEVHATERYVTGRYTKLPALIHYVDLSDYAGMRETLKSVQPDAIVHLAAKTSVAYSYTHASEVNETNFMATVNLVESARKVLPDIEHFVFAGTTEEYGLTKVRPVKETDAPLPNSPYSVSKLAASEYVLYMARAYGFPVSVTRCTNSYGRKGNRDFFVEKALSQMLGGSTVRLGDPRPIRELMYSSDHVEAYMKLIENGPTGRAFNFSTEEPLSLTEIVEVMRRVTGFTGIVEWHTIPERPSDIMDHRIDATRAHDELGWSAKVRLEEGLRLTMDGLQHED